MPIVMLTTQQHAAAEFECICCGADNYCSNLFASKKLTGCSALKSNRRRKPGYFPYEHASAASSPRFACSLTKARPLHAFSCTVYDTFGFCAKASMPIRRDKSCACFLCSPDGYSEGLGVMTLLANRRCFDLSPSSPPCTNAAALK